MRDWEESLAGCCGDVCSCCIVALCPFGCCLYQGLAVSKATGDGCCTPFCCPICLCCIGAGMNRRRVRERYLIKGNLCLDVLTHCLCGPCASCQEYREVCVRDRSPKWPPSSDY